VLILIYFASSQKITNLPDVPPGIADMYAGYITVGSNKNYFYWLVESANDPSTDPLILWLNGGPGCSSFAGLMSENGPFFPNPDGKLIAAPYSWNKFASVLYLESPAGVGFSYCTPQCGRYDDNTTASENYNFLLGFFAKYPKFSNVDFYISGESYAGHYIPGIVYLIYQNLATNPNTAPQSNFKGFAAGNPLTDEIYDFGNGINLYYQTHGMLPLNQASGTPSGNYDPYDILTDVCNDRIMNHIRFPHPFFNKSNEHKKRDVPSPYACIDDYVQTYLNRKDVKAAIHAKADITWRECGGPSYDFGDESMIPYYNLFMRNTQWKILVYSGDADTVLNFISTEQWIYSMKMNVKQSWRAWQYTDPNNGPQVGGWGVVFDRLTFKTIKGAGHMVPWYQPAPAFELISKWIKS